MSAGGGSTAMADSRISITDIIEYILHGATRSELDLVAEAVRRRLERECGLASGGKLFDARGAARAMAERIEKQMGIGAKSVHRAARRLVTDMVLKENPDISERELKELLDRWVPGKSGAGKMPRDMLVSMIAQFVAYSTGRMSEEEKRAFPPDWHAKYWEAFPAEVRSLIKAFIYGKIDKAGFWNGVEDILSNMK